MGIKNGFLEDFRKAVWNTSPVAKFINDNPSCYTSPIIKDGKACIVLSSFEDPTTSKLTIYLDEDRNCESIRIVIPTEYACDSEEIKGIIDTYPIVGALVNDPRTRTH